ncbi:hypothetical protein TM233_41870 [Bradyrhizobium sp. TM233]|nr:hypothetical protein TM233_41870 [Bradyrhizobium sp. TM233]
MNALACVFRMRNNPTVCVWRSCGGRDMRKQDLGFDYHRYHRLLSEADDEDKRLALIDLLIEEKARDRLAAQRASDRAAMTAHTIARVLKNGRN